MSLFQVFVSCFIVPLIVSIVLTLMELGKDKAEMCIVHMPRYAWDLGLVLTLISVCICIVGWSVSIPKWTWIASAAIGAIGVVFLLLFRSLQITYDKTGFRIKRFFVSKFYHYDEITGVTFGAGSQYTLYLKKGRVFVDNLAVGGAEFLNYAQVRWLEIGLGNEFPERRPRLFNGYLLNPKAFLFAYLVTPVLFSGLLVLFIVTSQTMRDIVILATITVIVWMGFVAIYFICSHAPKYEKIMPLFVKRDYWNF